MDTNDGKTTSTAWKTIQKAADTVGAGDTVNVKGGITYSDLGASSCIDASMHNESTVVCIRISGTVNNYITYRAWPGTGTPVVDATGKNQGIDIKSVAAYIVIDGFEVKNAGLNAPTTYNMDCILSDHGNNIIRNNIFHGCVGNALVILDFDTNAYQVYNNTFYGNNFGVSVINLIPPYSGSVSIYNNIFANSQIGLFKVNTGPSINSNYNLYYNNVTNYSGITAGSNDIFADPLFVSVETNDFRTKRNSPILNTGSSLLHSLTDILGVPRPQGSGYDIGAYEYYDIPVALTVTPGNYINYTKPTFSGTASTISTGTITSVSYSLDNGDWQSIGVTGTNNFTITIPNSLTDGIHTIGIRAQDSYNNLTDSSLYGTASFAIDTKVSNPVITNIGLIDNIPNKDNLTYYFTSTTPEVKGLADSLNTISFVSNNKIYTTTSDSNGNYIIKIDNLSLGTNTLTYYSTDLAGNESLHKKLTMIVGTSYFPQWLLEELGLVTKTNDGEQTNSNSSTTDNTTPVVTPITKEDTKTETKDIKKEENKISTIIIIVGGIVITGLVLVGIRYIRKGREF